LKTPTEKHPSPSTLVSVGGACFDQGNETNNPIRIENLFIKKCHNVIFNYLNSKNVTIKIRQIDTTT